MKPPADKESNTIKIASGDLDFGMYVSALDRPWLDTPFLFQGFPINDADDLIVLKNICDYVYIDALKSHYLPTQLRSNPLGGKTEVQRYTIQHSVERELKSASQAFNNSHLSIRKILHDVAKQKTLHTAHIREHINACVTSIERNPSALLWLTRIKHVDQYTAEHCINVGILAIALGRHLGVGRKHMELLGLCGMLHDVGKMRVNQAILNKPGKLTPDEYDHIKLHANYGRDVLKDDKALPKEVINAAYSHHERLDKKGYPEGIDAHYLSFYTKIVTIVDAYDAMTSRRSYSAGMTSAAALKILYDYSGKQFDPKLVVKFIECIGIYPPGSLVEMVGGEVGVVLSVDPSNRLLPKVALLLDTNKQPMLQTIVDLKAQREQPGLAQQRIKTVLMDGTYGINLEAFTQANLNISS